jgi:multicomponent K+:H+ antiporter subunit D
MTHLLLLPVLVPMLAGILALALHRQDRRVVRRLSLAATLLLAVVAVALAAGTADGTVAVVALGDWPAPFGIVFVADRLAALMVCVTAAVAVPALLAATAGPDAEDDGAFHPFFQFQLAGLNGAFLTGDLFNLFVFFEVLLIASYGLLMHRGKARAGMHYVVINLAGSAVFLVALALLYGTLGTLNLADAARRLPLVPAADAALVRTALALLVVVFLLKAAVLPLSLWLPQAYPAASPPVAALFAVMTKVGLYALLRVSAAAMPADAGPAASGLLDPWLSVLGLGTAACGMLGVLAATRLAGIAANLVLLSSGLLATALAEGGTALVAAALFYLPHTTLVTSALFLLAGRIAAARGESLRDQLVRGPRLPRRAHFGAAFFVLAVAASGLPPLSGFLGKLMLLQAAPASSVGVAFWAMLLLSGFVPAVVMARAASTLFWEPKERGAAVPPPPPPPAASPRPGLALTVALLPVPLLVLGAAPLSAYARATAEQLLARTAYLEAVLPSAATDVARERRP